MFATLPDVSPCLIHFLLVRPSLQEIADADLATLPWSSQPVGLLQLLDKHVQRSSHPGARIINMERERKIMHINTELQ